MKKPVKVRKIWVINPKTRVKDNKRRYKRQEGKRLHPDEKELKA